MLFKINCKNAGFMIYCRGTATHKKGVVCYHDPHNYEKR